MPSWIFHLEVHKYFKISEKSSRTDFKTQKKSKDTRNGKIWIEPGGDGLLIEHMRKSKFDTKLRRLKTVLKN